MTRKMRKRMRKAGGVIPHFARVGDLRAEIVGRQMMQLPSA